MFTRIRMRNFRSFRDVVFDLRDKSDTPKHIAIVYGENGAGKSNLASVFVLLNELMQTMDVRDHYEELLQKKSLFSDEKLDQMMRQRLLSGMRDIRAIIQDYRMVDSDEQIEVEYEFVINGYTGSYSIALGGQEIIHEHLEYKLNRRRGVYFDCSRNEIVINKGIVTDKDLLCDIKQAAKKYWGKHSILAIIKHELDDKSEAYVQESITGNFEDVLCELRLVSCYIGYIIICIPRPWRMSKKETFYHERMQSQLQQLQRKLQRAQRQPLSDQAPARGLPRRQGIWRRVRQGRRR